jgi:hypothetical protein
VHYLLAIYGREDIWSKWTTERMEVHMAAHAAYEQELRDAGVLVVPGLLPFSWESKTVRVRDGETLVDDGVPGTRLQLGGFFIIECGDIDEAVAWAAKMPNAALAREENEVQVRPIDVSHFKSDAWVERVI